MQSILESGKSVEERDHGGWSPFIRACENGHLEVAKFLNSKGAPVDDESGFGWTGLIQAASNGHLNVVKWLVENGATVDLCKNSDKETALWKAISHGHVDVAEYLMDHGANDKHVNHEETPMLIQACYKGQLPTVKFLLSRGADLQIRDKSYGNTAFLTACRWGNLELVKYLVSLGKIDIKETNHYGGNALNFAIVESKLDIVKYLFELGAKHPEAPIDSPIIGVPNVEMLNYLVDVQHWSLNVFSEYGTSPLAHAAYNGKLDLVKAMIQKGADPNAKDPKNGKTAYDTALSGNSSECKQVADYLATFKK